RPRVRRMWPASGTVLSSSGHSTRWSVARARSGGCSGPSSSSVRSFRWRVDGHGPVASVLVPRSTHQAPERRWNPMKRTYQILAALLAVEVVLQAMGIAYGTAGLFHWVDKDGGVLNHA